MHLRELDRPFATSILFYPSGGQIPACRFFCDSDGILFTTYHLCDNDFHGSENTDLDLPDKASSIISPDIFNIFRIDT